MLKRTLIFTSTPALTLQPHHGVILQNNFDSEELSFAAVSLFVGLEIENRVRIETLKQANRSSVPFHSTMRCVSTEKAKSTQMCEL
jgi:hypothetical protein